MVLSTAIPIVIAAIVIVIISKGIDKYPIIPKIKDEAKILGIMATMLNFIDLNNTINIMNIKIITKPSDLICESNKESNILLYKTNNPFTLKFFTDELLVLSK